MRSRVCAVSFGSSGHESRLPQPPRTSAPVPRGFAVAADGVAPTPRVERRVRLQSRCNPTGVDPVRQVHLRRNWRLHSRPDRREDRGRIPSLRTPCFVTDRTFD